MHVLYNLICLFLYLEVGNEAFAVMHMIRAFLGKRPDHAPAELTVVRLRLSSGIELPASKEICHVFPSPK